MRTAYARVMGSSVRSASVPLQRVYAGGELPVDLQNVNFMREMGTQKRYTKNLSESIIRPSRHRQTLCQDTRKKAHRMRAHWLENRLRGIALTI